MNTQLKEKILNSLSRLEELYKIKSDEFRRRSFANALNSLKKIQEIPDTKKELLKINKVGKSVADVVIEIIKTGKSERLKKLEKELKDIEKLVLIDGISPKFAYKLIKKYNIKNVKQLKKAYKKGKIELDKTQILGVKYFKDLQKRIPTEEISKFDKQLQLIVKDIDPNLIAVIAGSYRRGLKTSGDIDIILTHKNVITDKDIKIDYIDKVVEKLKEHYKYIDKFSKGKKKFMGLFIIKKYVRHLDIWFAPYQSYYSLLLHATGSKNFNIQTREIAKELGYKINENYIKKGDKKIYLKSEKEFFDILNIPYLKPNERE